MRIQHQLGADIMFAFDECTTLMNTRGYQEQSVERTHPGPPAAWPSTGRLTAERRPAVPGAVRRGPGRAVRGPAPAAARGCSSLDVDGRGFDGYGIGGALEKENLGTIVGWVCEELPEDKPRHLLGISEPDDFFTAIENGADTFDCVSPSRVARNAAVYTPRRAVQRHQRRAAGAPSARSTPSATATPARTTPGPTCTTCSRPSEMLASTLCTIHNERFIVRLVDRHPDQHRERILR